MKFKLLAIAALLFVNVKSFSQDKNFYIFLCFGQSNMEGGAPIETRDVVWIDPRIKVLQAVDCVNLNRVKDKWYTAKPPLCRCWTGLSPADYFARTVAANLPKNIKIGIINVSIAGAKMEIYQQSEYKSYLTFTPDWMQGIAKDLGGNPYARLVELAKMAQKVGVIKGILLHQGESNKDDAQWTSRVKEVYDKLLADIKLTPNAVPLLAGETVNADQGGICADMNKQIATLPKIIPNAYVISSAGCTAGEDKLHFDAAGCRELGRRYGIKMLALLKKPTGFK
ncbi:sialate O-acetylesterase [Mucilaginibacter calamicampi]|uniref:Sialate O-acetylesterase n=1 Tax=Mucilaginibacter calamicampi TaxID=1302352 RepID=A0ABW2YSH4_9SPHI